MIQGIITQYYSLRWLYSALVLILMCYGKVLVVWKSEGDEGLGCTNSTNYDRSAET